MARLHGFDRGHGTTWFAIRRALKELATSTLVVLRNRGELQFMLDEVMQLRRDLLKRVSIRDPQALQHVLETENLLLTAEVMVRAALLRTESRGSHFRDDHPERDDRRWLTSIFWRLEDEVLVPSLSRYRQDPRSSVQVQRLGVEAVEEGGVTNQ